MPEEAAPQGLEVQFQLKIFFSIDIVGSTEFKSKAGRAVKHSDPAHWARPFLAFYESCRTSMGLHWRNVRDEMKRVTKQDEGHFKFGDPPAFWKGAGDEVLFAKTLHSPLDALASVQALLLVMADQRKRFLAKPITERLDVKGTAWLAGFPINNLEIVLGQDAAAGEVDEIVGNFTQLATLRSIPDKMVLRDYIGPSVDLGFRLRAYSSARKMVVSADLVWLLCQTGKYNPEYEKKCELLKLPRIGYDGTMPLKGIMNGDPYPMFWIEAAEASQLDRAGWSLLGHAELAETTPERKKALQDYCQEYLGGSHELRMRPYIEKSFDDDVALVPATHQERFQNLVDWVTGSKEQYEDIQRKDESAGGPVSSGREEFLDSVKPAAPETDKQSAEPLTSPPSASPPSSDAEHSPG